MNQGRGESSYPITRLFGWLPAIGNTREPHPHPRSRMVPVQSGGTSERIRFLPREDVGMGGTPVRIAYTAIERTTRESPASRVAWSWSDNVTVVILHRFRRVAMFEAFRTGERSRERCCGGLGGPRPSRGLEFVGHLGMIRKEGRRPRRPGTTDSQQCWGGLGGPRPSRASPFRGDVGSAPVNSRQAGALRRRGVLPRRCLGE